MFAPHDERSTARMIRLLSKSKSAHEQESDRKSRNSLFRWFKKSLVPTGSSMTRCAPAVCTAFICLFGFICVMQWLKYGFGFPEIRDDKSLNEYKEFSRYIGISFLTLFCVTLIVTLTSDGAHRACAMASCTVSLICAISHFSPSFEICPITASHSRIPHITVHARWAEWMTTTPLLIFLIGHITQIKEKFVFVAMGTQFLVIAFGYLFELASSVWVKLFCITIALILYGLIMLGAGLLCYSLHRYRSIHFCTRCTDTSEMSLPMVRLLGTAFCTLWIIFPLVYLLNFGGIVPERLYLLSAPFFDVSAKGVFIAMLNAAHTKRDTLRVEAMMDQLKEQNQMQSKFLRFVYHEIRNPFNSIMLGLNHLEDEDQLIQYKPLISMLRKSATAMNRVIDDVVELTKVQGTMQISAEPVSLRVVLTAAIATQVKLAEQKRITVDYDVSTSLPEKIIGDRSKLVKMFQSLISNAVKFSPEGKCVNVVLEVEEFTGPDVCSVAFSVEDDGPGVPNEVVPLLFEPFSHVRPGDFSEDEDRGSGLGLCLTKHLADLMGAKISYAPKKDKGSIFKITYKFEVIPEEEKKSDHVHSKTSRPVRRLSGSIFRPRIEKDERERGKSLNSGSVNKHKHSVSFKDQSRKSSIMEPLRLRRPSPQILATNKDDTHIFSLWTKEGSKSAQKVADMAGEQSFSSKKFSPISTYRSRLQTDRHRSSMMGSLRSVASGPKDQPEPFLALFQTNGETKRNSGESLGKTCNSQIGSVMHTFASRMNTFAENDPCNKSYFQEPFVEGSEMDSVERGEMKMTATVEVVRRTFTPQAEEVTYLTELDNLKEPKGKIFLPAINGTAIPGTIVTFNPGEADVLIVDDVKSNVKLACMILTKAGYTCDTADNGLASVQMAAKHKYKLIIMDNVMPVMNGIDATRHIRAFDLDVVIVGLTGNILQKDQNEFLAAGAKEIVQKPADKSKLIGICEKYVHKKFSS